MIKGVLLDLSGVLYVGDTPIDGAFEAISRLQASGLPMRFITNTSRKTRRQVVEQLNGMGFSIAEDQVFTCVVAARDYLASHGLQAHLLVHPNIRREFEAVPAQQANAVVLGDAAEDFTYTSLNAAFRVLSRSPDIPLIAMGYNRYFKEQDGLSLDLGPFVKALEFASGKQAIITGKPDPTFFHQACDAMGCQPGETLMIGDDAVADVEGAKKAGLMACLVKTGKYQPGDEEHIDPAADYLAENLLDAVKNLPGLSGHPASP